MHSTPLRDTAFYQNDKGGWANEQIARGFKMELVNGSAFWSANETAKLLQAAADGADISPPHYPSCARGLATVLHQVSAHGKSAIVFGSVSPWAEATLLTAGVSRVVTVDYNQPGSEDLRLETAPISRLPLFKAQFDLAVSFSALEHDGLGRYGDPMDPDGDFHAMQEVAYVLKPGGTLLLGMPVGLGGLYFNAHRMYSKTRFQRLVDGWKYIGYVDVASPTVFNTQDWDLASIWTGDDWQNQPWFALEKPL